VPIEIRAPGQDDLAPMLRADGRAYGFDYEPDDAEMALMFVDPPRFRLAFDQGAIVGIAGSFGLDLTVPGGAAVPMGGVTWVSVATTHRRQGLLRRLLDAVHADIDERGDACAGLGASEGSIYERFGYGVATYIRHVTIDKHTARFRPEFVPPPGTVRFIDDDDAKGYLADVWERSRRRCPGETTRSASWWDGVFAHQRKPRDGYSSVFRVVHRDGYAAYRIKTKWGSGFPASELEVVELVAATPEAHNALWYALMNVDLVGTVTRHWMPLDDPLPLMLDNARAVRTEQLRDCLWLQPRDFGALLRARTYGTDDAFVLEVHDPAPDAAPVRWTVDGGPGGATASRTRRRPDLVLGQAALGAIYLGGVRSSYLAAGRLIQERTAGALRRADLFFSADRLPFTQNPF
jgi:predicted acetyltransferase